MLSDEFTRDIEAFDRLKPRLGELWDRIFPGDEEAYTSVVVPSLTLDQSEMAKIAGIAFYEERLLFLLMRLRNPRAHVVYVTSQPIHPLVLEYYLQLLVGVPASHARARLTLLCAYDNTPRSLTEKILERPRLLERIRRAIPDLSRAYLTVFNATPLERRLAVQLDIPMNAADPAHAHFGSKSGSRRLFREAGIAMPLGVEDLRSQDDVVHALQAMKCARPELRRAVLKLDDSFSGEGNAIFTFPGPASASAAAFRDALQHLRFAVGTETSDSYFEKFARLGGIAEEMIEQRERTSPSVQLRINPRGEVILASTHEQILGGFEQQVYLGCRFPAEEGYRTQIQEAALRVGHLLAGKGVIGRLSIDFLAWPAGQAREISALEINLRMGGTTHPMLALRFLTGGSIDVQSGLFLTPGAQSKFYRASDNVQSDRYRGLLPEDLIEILVLNRLDFDHRTGTGVLFHLIGAISQFGKVGLTAIGNSRMEAEQLFERTIEVLDRETRGPARKEKVMDPDAECEQINRETAIARLRAELIALSGAGKSACQIAAERKILCGGFRRDSDEQLRHRYRAIVAENPSMSRTDLEARANEWQLRRQREVGTLTCCDAQWQNYETCAGWDDFANDELAHFCLQMLGQRVEVVGAKTWAAL